MSSTSRAIARRRRWQQQARAHALDARAASTTLCDGYPRHFPWVLGIASIGGYLFSRHGPRHLPRGLTAIAIRASVSLLRGLH